VNSNITIEKLDAVIERVSSATYAEAKQALLECDGDVIEAVILLELQKGFYITINTLSLIIQEIFLF